MQHEVAKYLHDMQRAADLATEFIEGHAYADYAGSAMLRSAVERQLQILGDAMSQLARLDPAAASRVTNYRDVIGFRNVLVHGYAEVDHQLVWNIVQVELPILKADVATLLGD
jgi:uncharacterized protein with HEPN domain